MRRILRALSGYGWLAALVAALVVGLVVVYVEPPKPHEAIPNPAPAVPEHAKGEDARGVDEEGATLVRGVSVGATPNKVYPRPVDRGFRYSFVSSPHWSGRGMHLPEAVVVHVFGSGTCAGLKSWFTNPQALVSAHFGVCKDGSIVQFVELGDAAWHAGEWRNPALSQPLIASWFLSEPRVNPNSVTVGIEVDLKPGQVLGSYPEMTRAFDDLLLWVVQELRIPPDRMHILAHAEIDSVNRAVDPWCCIDINLSAAFTASRLAPSVAPIVLTLDSLNERLLEIERRLGIQP